MHAGYPYLDITIQGAQLLFLSCMFVSVCLYLITLLLTMQQTKHDICIREECGIYRLCSHCTYSVCAGTKTILDRTSVHTQKRLWRRDFRDGSKLRRADF